MDSTPIQKIKDFYFNHYGRFSRETFVIGFVGLILFVSISSVLLFTLCKLFLPFIINLFILFGYVGYVLYANFVIAIKRLKDLRLSGWFSILILFPFIHLFLYAFLCLKKGKEESASEEEYESPPLRYSGPKFLLIICYVFLALIGLTEFRLYVQWRDLAKVVKMSQGSEDKSAVARKLVEQMPKSLRDPSLGIVFLGEEYIASGATISSQRLLITGRGFKDKINQALSQNQKLVFQSLTKKQAQITRFVAGNDSRQFYVFELDQAIGVPGKLNDENRKILEQMGAF